MPLGRCHAENSLYIEYLKLHLTLSLWKPLMKHVGEVERENEEEGEKIHYHAF